MDSENITLKPLPPQIYNCSACKNQFLSRLRVNGKFIDLAMIVEINH